MSSTTKGNCGNCPSCQAMRIHAPEEMKEFHPLSGHGFTPESGWTHPDCVPKKAAEMKAK